jgi:prepilin-type N-terminal cleavage/methylation domain-containing protein
MRGRLPLQNSTTAAPRGRRSGRNAGFTLIEVVLVIAIIGLLLGAVLTPLATQYAVRKNKETQQALDDIRQALVGFAEVNGRLPCPDDPLDGVDGVEDYTNNATPALDTCVQYEGYLPYVTLGVSPVDSWGRLYHYGVHPEFIQTTSPGAVCLGLGDDQLGLCDTPNIVVLSRGDNPATAPAIESKSQVTLSQTAPAVVVSVGSNGLGGRDIAGNILAVPANNTDEIENSLIFIVGNGNAANRFVSRGHTPAGAGCDETTEGVAFCQFDDLVIWIPARLLHGRLVEAGRLP